MDAVSVAARVGLTAKALCAAEAAYARVKGGNGEPCMRLQAGQNPLRAIELRTMHSGKSIQCTPESPTMHFGMLNHASCRVQPCKLPSPTMQVPESNHASSGVQPCKFQSPTMQVPESNHASCRRHKGFHRIPSGLSAMRMARPPYLVCHREAHF